MENYKICFFLFFPLEKQFFIFSTEIEGKRPKADVFRLWQPFFGLLAAFETLFFGRRRKGEKLIKFLRFVVGLKSLRKGKKNCQTKFRCSKATSI